MCHSSASWDFPPPPAALHSARLARGASHSRFLRIALVSTQERADTSPAHPHPRSSYHSLKRRSPQWPKPPHYHASLLRSPLSRRKGLFRAVLPSNKAVDFFRRDFLLGPTVSTSASPEQRDKARPSDVASLHVAEFVLEPYEAATGFSGWHGLGLDAVSRVESYCDQHCRPSSDLQLDIDEALVDEGRARWARTAEDLVGPTGLSSRWLIRDGTSDKLAPPFDPTRKGPDSRASSSREEVRWHPDIASTPFHSSRPTSVLDEMARQPPPSSAVPTSKPDLKTDSPSSACWHRPSSHRPQLHTPFHRLPPPPPVQFAPPPVHFSPYFPGGRVASAQGHGYWYSGQPMGTPPSVNRDANQSKSLPHAHTLSAPVTLVHPPHSPRHPTKPNLALDEYAPGHDYDRETDTDHGYESTTTTTDSDPPPHTPIGAMTSSHCVEAPQLHEDDEVQVYDVELDAEPVIGWSDPDTPVKLLGRFSLSSPSSLVSSNQSSKGVVVFPSLNGSFRQGSLSRMSYSQGVSAQTTPARAATSASSPPSSSAKGTAPLGLGDEHDSTTRLESESAGSDSGDENPAFMLNVCSPSSSSSGLRKDSQGFWEPVTPISPCSSTSSLPLSPTEGKGGSKPIDGWISEMKGPHMSEESQGSSTTSSQSTHSIKSRSLSPGPRRAVAGPTYLSSPQPTSFSSPTTTLASASVFGGSYPSSPSPLDSSSLVPPNPTTLLPAFLATATVKRKKASRTREIVDRLRSSSIDAGKGDVDSLGWLAGPNAGVIELEGPTLGKASTGSEHATGSHGATRQLSLEPSSDSTSTAWSGPGSGKNHGHGRAPGAKSSDLASSSGSGVKSNGTTNGSESLFPSAAATASSRNATGGNPSITPFPILTVSENLTSNIFTATHSNMNNQTIGVMSGGGDGSGPGSKMSAGGPTAASQRARNPGGAQYLPGAPNGGGTSPSAHASHHPLPSPSHPTTVQPLNPQPAALGPPPPPTMLAVSAYPHSHPMYAPFTQYRLAPPLPPPPLSHQQAQGTWLAVYPGRPPPHLAVHGMPVGAQAHISPITGVSGIRHATW